MFPHEEHLKKALDESSSITQLINDLVMLHLDKANRQSPAAFKRAVDIQRIMDKALEEIGKLKPLWEYEVDEL